MKCPVCQTTLARVKYESFRIQKCPKCHGHLLARKRLESIKRHPGNSVTELKKEVLEEAAPDTKQKIRCPRCRLSMKKRFLDAPASVHFDFCQSCDVIWLDGGELARIQLTYEISSKGRDAIEFRKRFETLSAEERKTLNAKIRAMPDKQYDQKFHVMLMEAFFEAAQKQGRYPGLSR